jgi:hypothetical protein
LLHVRTPLSGCPVWERQHKYNTMNPI